MLSASKTRAAPQFGPSCMQPEDVPKSEDCLTLNVWRDQRLLQATPVPVMVRISGGRQNTPAETAEMNNN
jgi:para-nitrobenzyl esterase